MDNIVITLIAGLATYYLALLFTQEDGPFKIFHKLRVATGAIPQYLLPDSEDEDALYTWQYVGDNYKGDHEGRRYEAKSQLSKILTCNVCFAMYGAPCVYAISLFVPELIIIFAIAGTSVVFKQFG